MTENGGLPQVNGGSSQYWEMSNGQNQTNNVIQKRLARACEVIKQDPQLQAAKFDRCQCYTPFCVLTSLATYVELYHLCVDVAPFNFPGIFLCNPVV